MITKGSLKGYHGLVKAEDPNGVDVELDAKVASHGLAKQHFQYGDFQVECVMCCPRMLLASHKPL
jgi:hypothetical protein